MNAHVDIDEATRSLVKQIEESISEEFKLLGSKLPQSRVIAARAQIVTDAVLGITNDRPVLPKDYAQKTIRSLWNQFLVIQGYSAAEITQAERAAKKARRPKARPERKPIENGAPRTIRLNDWEILETVDLSEQALLEAARPVYQRGGKIVSATLAKAIDAHGKVTSFQCIEEKGDHSLLEELSLSACYEQWDSRLGNGGAWKAVAPPMWIVKTLRQRDQKRLRPLMGIISAPIMRVDGSILSEPGYDEATGLLYDPRGVEFPDVPDRPSLDEAIGAMETLKTPLSKFDFVSDVDRAVALSAILTAVVRRSLATAPLHTFSAPTRGSGKSKLVDIASVVVSGEPASVIAQGDSEEEFEKRIGACLMDGRSIIAIDNCRRPLADIEVLSSMLTQSDVSARILGMSKMPKLPCSVLVTATGNNLTVMADLTRRSLRCELDPGCERPELRPFDFEPVEVAKQMRSELVVAALTILRAFHVADRPAGGDVEPLGSFEDWSGLVRGALLWLGCDDPVKSMESLREDDPEQTELVDVFSAWSDIFGSVKVSVSELVEKASQCDRNSASSEYANPQLRDALLAVAGRGGQSTPSLSESG